MPDRGRRACSKRCRAALAGPWRRACKSRARLGGERGAPQRQPRRKISSASANTRANRQAVSLVPAGCRPPTRQASRKARAIPFALSKLVRRRRRKAESLQNLARIRALEEREEAAGIISVPRASENRRPLANGGIKLRRNFPTLPMAHCGSARARARESPLARCPIGRTARLAKYFRRRP